MIPSATVIADSIYVRGTRLTTIEATMHRFVLAEFNTHRLFSRNSASSRAIPINKQIIRVLNDPAIPLKWGRNQSGMQAATPFTGIEALESHDVWLRARDAAVEAVRALQNIGEEGVHKQIANRLLEPFMWHTVIVTSTEWENFFHQRRSPLAQPEIRAVADAMHVALEHSHPQCIDYGDWHLPYIQPDEDLTLEDKKRISAARCARVSYLTQNGVRDPQEDLLLFDRLVTADPMHASPLEHVATPDPFNESSPGNFEHWLQLRHVICGPRRPCDVYTPQAVKLPTLYEIRKHYGPR